MRYYLGPWVWRASPLPAWRAPVGAVGVIDLRSSAQSAIPVTVTGNAFFTTPDAVDLGSDYDLLGEGDLRSLNISSLMRSALETKLGIPVTGTTLLDCLWDILTVRAAPDGQLNNRPLMPTRSGHMDIHLGGHGRLLRRDFDLAGPEGAGVIDALQRQYRSIRRDALDGKLFAGMSRTSDPEFHRRVLDAWAQKYRVNNPEDYFIPGDLPKEMRLRHATTITDDFNRANNDNISTGAPVSWTENEGDLDILSNAVVNGAGADTNARGQAEQDLSSDDHYAQIDYAGVTGEISVCSARVRQDGAANTNYNIAIIFETSTFGTPDTTIGKYVAGTPSELVIGTGTKATSGTIRMIVDGSSLSSLYNGAADKGPTTDTDITGNLRTGIRIYQNGVNPSLDNFVAEDVGIGFGPMFRGS